MIFNSPSQASNNKIPFGLKDGVLHHISEVLSGLACGCVCPSCLVMLQANKGTRGKRVHYFSHDPSSNAVDCKKTFETSIHMMAKQILEKRKNTIFPMLEISMSMEDDNGVEHTEKIQVTEKTMKSFSRVELEKKLADIRPDIIAYTSSQIPILIEVAVTHFSDAQKKEKIRNLGLFAIEIDLSGISYFITEEELSKLIIEEFENKKWLSNPLAIQSKIELSARLAQTVSDANLRIAASKKDYLERLQKKLPKPYSQKKNQAIQVSVVAEKNEYTKRWFICDKCRHLFDKSFEEAPYTLITIDCPECKFSVSTSPV